MVAIISVKSATAPAVTSCEGDGEAQASEDEDSEQMCGILGADVVWDCGETSAGVRPHVGRQARLGSLGRGGVGGLLHSWYGLRGLPLVAILDGGLGRRGKGGVVFLCCLLLGPPIQARQIRALASR